MISRRPESGIILLALLFPLLLIHCAGQIFPPGGPVDSIPPVVMRTDPDSGATRVNELRVEIEFSEYVDRRSVEESIFISPPVTVSEFDWSGTEVTVTSEDSLRPNTTYVLSIGTDVVDVRAGNRMASGFTLAFSTGDSLDRGSVAGKVYAKEPEGITIFAYLLTGMNPDTLNPSVVKPHYVMQTGKGGEYRISNLAWGMYRLIAVRDQYKNFLYDRQVDQYGVWRGDVLLSPDTPEAAGVSFRLSIEDTTAPFLSAAQALNSNRILFRFSEPIDSSRFLQSSISITDTVSGLPVKPLLVYQDGTDLTSGGIVTESPLDPGTTYKLTALGVSDSAGRMIDSSNASLFFAGSSAPDTIAPVMSFLSFADTVMGYPLSRPFILSFNEPIRTSITGGVRLTGPNEKEEVLSIRWLSPVAVVAVPKGPLKPASAYTLSVIPDSVRDLAGNVPADSVFAVRFASFNPLRSGELSGRIDCSDCPPGGRLFVAGMKLSDGWSRMTPSDSLGTFHLEGLDPGKYVLSVFRDDDSSAGYTYGLPFPYTPSEPFVVGRDTVRVRARWGVEGIVIRFP